MARRASFPAIAVWSAAFVSLLASVAPVRAQLLPAEVIGEGQLTPLGAGMPPPFLGNCEFGGAVARLGDLDGDGLVSIAVGAPGDSSNVGAVWVLELEADGQVSSATRIGAEPFGLGSALSLSDQFGHGLDAIGDLNGDGVTDLAVGAPGDLSGALWLLFLAADGGLAGSVRIAATTPGFCATLESTDDFGGSVTCLGDLDGDGQPEVAVGARSHDFGATNAGAVFVLSLTPAGELAHCTRLGSGENGVPALGASHAFGHTLAAPGDLSGDGTPELVVGAPGDTAGENVGALWILSLDPAGQVTATRKLTGADVGAGFNDNNLLGLAAGAAGDLDGDGVPDLAVGSPGDDDGALNAGALWILFLQADGSVRALQKVSNLAGGFGGLINGADFGTGLPPSLRGDAQPLLAGAPGGGPAGETGKGATWLLTLSPAGTVLASTRIAAGVPGLSGGIEPADAFGSAAAFLGDRDEDGLDEFLVGAPVDGDGFVGAGALWLLELDANGTPAQPPLKLSGLQGVLGLQGSAAFGTAIAPLGDLSGDGTLEVAVGAPNDGAGLSAGAVWILSLSALGEIVSQVKLGAQSPGLPAGGVSGSDAFGSAVAGPGDLDGDGVPDLLVGATLDDDGGSNVGAVWVLLLDPTGGIKATHKLSDTQGELGGGLAAFDNFGAAIAVFGDTDADGRVEIAVGSPFSDGAGPTTGSVWLIELEAGGAGAHDVVELNAVTGDLQGLAFATGFGTALSTLPDLDADGRPELVAGMPQSPLGLALAGAVAVLSIRPDGSVRDRWVFGLGTGGFAGALLASDNFGRAVCPAGDLDHNGATDLLVGAPLAHDAVWTVRLERGAWSALGTALPGSQGPPFIAALGPLVPGAPLVFELDQARSYSPCWLMLGVTELLAPFKGGVLVPAPLFLVPQSTDGFGSKSFAVTWPAGAPSGGTLYAQWWIMDPNAVQDLASTHGARGLVP